MKKSRRTRIIRSGREASALCAAQSRRKLDPCSKQEESKILYPKNQNSQPWSKLLERRISRSQRQASTMKIIMRITTTTTTTSSTKSSKRIKIRRFSRSLKNLTNSSRSSIGTSKMSICKWMRQSLSWKRQRKRSAIWLSRWIYKVRSYRKFWTRYPRSSHKW